ncbi:hypothetical protein V5799_029972 [Amblyomma americanum]|uniref:Uncharacterized protein n=1 Tax=Amblyomma americanum TaxID=6943 RepID=A0AAQ4EQ57_AMBAM
MEENANTIELRKTVHDILMELQAESQETTSQESYGRSEASDHQSDLPDGDQGLPPLNKRMGVADGKKKTIT